MTSQKWALLSVYQKDGIVDFAKGLKDLGYHIASTGGTAKLLMQSGVDVSEVASLTDSPEMLDGRVKTLHPRIHGGILYDRNNSEHLTQLEKFKLPSIEIVAVNLYAFPHGISVNEENMKTAIELIDIGGPTMLRGAAKNFLHTLSVIDPTDYPSIISRLRGQTVDFAFRKQLAAKTFAAIAAYDRSIAQSLGATVESGDTETLKLSCKQKLRYGENPQQQAELWLDAQMPGAGRDSELGSLQCLQGKELSYNNLLDIEASTQLAREFDAPFTAVVVKHTNPCGVATGANSLRETLAQAIASDPVSAFGGIIALTQKVDKATAQLICEQFYECIVAPGFAPDALELLSQKKNLRAVVAEFIQRPPHPTKQLRSLFDGFLRQDSDTAKMNDGEWRVVSTKGPSENVRRDMLFSMLVTRHVKSNAIVIVKDGRTIGVGAGQMSRIDAAEIAIKKAKQHGHSLSGAVVGSDAFFPFRDCVDLFASEGIAAIAQPGGSVRDQESVDAANQYGLVMLFTGNRHFKH